LSVSQLYQPVRGESRPKKGEKNPVFFAFFLDSFSQKTGQNYIFIKRCVTVAKSKIVVLLF